MYNHKTVVVAISLKHKQLTFWNTYWARCTVFYQSNVIKQIFCSYMVTWLLL